MINIHTIGHTIVRLDSVDSTNNYAANLINTTNVVNGTVILAKNQFSGRGQRGNKWIVSDGKDLTCSIILNQISTKSNEQFLLSQWISVSVIQLLKYYNIEAQIKWPNDILIKGSNKKIAGILIENSLRGENISNSIIGLGLNINNTGYQELMNASSFNLELNKLMRIEDVFQKLIELLNSNYILLSTQKERLKKEYFSYLLGYNDVLKYEENGNRFEAKIETILPDGRLVLEDDLGEKRTFLFKEVSLIL